MPSLQSQLPDCSATLDRLNELKLSQTSLIFLEVIFKVTFSLALPSWLLKLPIVTGRLSLTLVSQGSVREKSALQPTF